MARYRVAFGFVAVILLSSGCSGVDGTTEVSASVADDRSTTTTTTTATPAAVSTTSRVPPTTTAPTVGVSLVLDDVERLAARGGVMVSASSAGELLGYLDDGSPRLSAELDPAAMVEFRFVDVDRESTEVVWSQPLESVEMTVVQPWREERPQADRELVAWQTGGDSAAYLQQLSNADPLTVTSPVSWIVTGEGDVTGGVDSAFVAQAHARGLEVWPAVQGLDADALHLLMADDQKRSSAAQSIAADALVSGADGVNIDIEGFRVEDAASVTAFVEEVAALVHAWEGTVSYDLVPRSDSWDVSPSDVAHWSTAPERRELAAAVDYTVLMAYDQHNRLRPAGPVAAPAWVEEVLIYMLRYADPETVLLGVPAYGRIWDPAALDAPRAVSLRYLDGLDGTRVDDPEFSMVRVELDDGRFFWADNEVDAARISLAEDFGLAGWAVWRLGLDDLGLWGEFPPNG